MNKMVIVCSMVSLLLSGGQALAASCTCLGMYNTVGNTCGSDATGGAYLAAYCGVTDTHVLANFLRDKAVQTKYMTQGWAVDWNTGWACRR